MDSDNNASDSEHNSNPTSPTSTGDTSSPVATRSNLTADNTSDNDSVKTESRDSSPERLGPQSPMPEEVVEDGPQSPAQSPRSSRSNSASRSSPTGPESPPGEPAGNPPPPSQPPANNASTNGGANAGSDGEDGSISSSSSSEGRKPGSSINRSRSSSRGSRQARRQANLDDGITTSEDDSDSADSSRSSVGSGASRKDDKDDRSRRIRSPPSQQHQQQRPSIDVQPEAISDGDMESESSDEEKPPSPIPSPKVAQEPPQASPPPPPPQSSGTKDTVKSSESVSNQHAPDLNLAHDDLSDVSDLDDSMGVGDSDNADKLVDSDGEEGRCSDEEVDSRERKRGDDKSKSDKQVVDEDGILSPVNVQGKDDYNDQKSSAEPNKMNTINKSNQLLASPLSKPLHPRITHDNNNRDDNEEEQLDFEAEDGEQQDQEESSETNKDNNANTNSTVNTSIYQKEHEEKLDKSPKHLQKVPLLPTPSPADESNKKPGNDSKDDGNNSTSTSNGKVPVKEPIELEEGEVSDEDEARPEETEPRPVCRFFSRGQCTWGASCRFLHPGVTDKGHYTMFEVVRPTLLSEYGTVPPNARVPSLLDDPRIQAPQQPPLESAWERGLRTAKEMLRKSIKRKEQDMDFEEKKMNMTLAQQQDEEEDGLREAENGGGYYMSGSGRTPSIPAAIHERETIATTASSRHHRPPAATDIRERDIDAMYGREASLRMEQQQRHMDQRHLERLERIAAAEVHQSAGHRSGGTVMMLEREHRRGRGDMDAEEYYQHQMSRTGGRYQMAGGQMVPAHHLIYQEEYSTGTSQRPSMHPSARSYTRHPSDLAPSHQHHPASHLAPSSYRDHRPEYYHDQRTREPSKYIHATSPLDGGEGVMTAETPREGRESRSRGATGRREVIVQRAEVIEQQQQQQLQQLQRERSGMEAGYRMATGGRHAAGMIQMMGARPDEWADPWMRSKSPGGGKSGGKSKTGKKRSYSSASSYSSSSNSSSRSHSTSHSSVRSSLRSRSRSPHGGQRHGNLVPPRHGGGRGAGRGGGRQAVSPSVIVSERKAANERAAAMNPPAPKRPNKAPSPGMMRAGAQNPPAPHQPHHHTSQPPSSSSTTTTSNRNKLVLAAAALAARKQHQRVAAVAAAVVATGARRRSSSGSSSGSSSDTDSSSGSSSGSDDDGSSGSGGSRGRRAHNRRNANSAPNSMGAGAASNNTKREIALGLALKQAKAIDALSKSSSGVGPQEKRAQIKLNLKAPLTSAGNAKKRPVPNSPPGGGSSGGSGGQDAKKKGSSSRREELLKQLKAVEDAIAKKRSKV